MTHLLVGLTTLWLQVSSDGFFHWRMYCVMEDPPSCTKTLWIRTEDESPGATLNLAGVPGQAFEREEHHFQWEAILKVYAEMKDINKLKLVNYYLSNYKSLTYQLEVLSGCSCRIAGYAGVQATIRGHYIFKNQLRILHIHLPTRSCKQERQ